MSTIVLLTEDNQTGEAIRILAQKSLLNFKKPPKVIRRHIKRGRIFKRPEKLAALVRVISQQQRNARFIVCVDSECTDPQITQRNLEKCKTHLKNPRLVVDFVIIVHALEAWLAIDENALAAILRPKGKMQIPANIETECRPEEILKEIFRRQGKDFDKSAHDMEIAKNADPQKIASRSASFRRFQQLLKNH